MSIDDARHDSLRSLLGAWALDACPRREAAEVARHLTLCPECAEEASRLRNAAARLSADDPLDPPGSLRQQVLDWCLARRPAELPVPAWAAPYAAETAKLDALLRDLGPDEWHEVAELPWHGGVQRWRPAEVLCHLAAVDGLLAPALGLPDPVPGAAGPAGVPPRVPPQAAPGLPSQPPPPGHGPLGVLERSERLMADLAGSDPAAVRSVWRRHSQTLVRGAALRADGAAPVDFGFATVPLGDAFLDRAFECWIHGDDIARAVDYPYAPPKPGHLRSMIDLAARMLPLALAELRQPQPEPAGFGGPPPRGRVVRMVADGPGGGEWLIPLDGPGPPPDDADPIASMVLDGLDFCRLAAAHQHPEHVLVGEFGDRTAIREVLRAAPLLSRP
ncbi:zf-HC2 domain-containing protein [Kitasatospora sp. HPMI-4]|uniref:zf-HC2 domain-containing protein n=1 Tax=Kitasatospora sp. HPMI-4 TaxID=3448443 RepID=UPI003F1AAF80